MARKQYEAQVQLLVRLLPIVAGEEDFALKGGTAINLFYRDLPRLSVDIDLTYLPIKDRGESLTEIQAAMARLAAVASKLPNIRATQVAGGGGGATRVLARSGAASVKIETSPVNRGVVFPAAMKRVSAAVEERFGFAETKLVAFADLYGGKLHAALDRQHPRDLYDVHLLYENEGLTDEVFKAFLVYVASSGRPPHELLDPGLAEISAAYENEFVGMTEESVSLEALLSVRETLIKDLRDRLTGDIALFLTSLQDGAPNFDLIGLPSAADLPAVRWKLLNIERLKEANPDKHQAQGKLLAALCS